MKKPKVYYITNSEYQTAVERFHNGLEYTSHIDYKEWRGNLVIESASLEDVLEEDEEVYYIPSTPLAVTNLGRMVNLKWIRPIKPTFHNQNVYFNVAVNYMASDLFEAAGWEFDKEIMLSNYRSREWKYKLGHNCTYC